MCERVCMCVCVCVRVLVWVRTSVCACVCVFSVYVVVSAHVCIKLERIAKYTLCKSHNYMIDIFRYEYISIKITTMITSVYKPMA